MSWVCENHSEKTSRNAERRAVSEARDTKRGEHEHGFFPGSEPPEETDLLLSITHSLLTLHARKHTLTAQRRN